MGLNDAIVAEDNAAANNGVITIALGGDIALGGTALYAINLATGTTLDIECGGFALDGGGTQRGLFVYA